MSAPVTERVRAAAKGAATRTRTDTIPAQRALRADPARERVGAPGEPAKRVDRRSTAKAYARRDDRLRRLVGGRQARTAAPPRRAQFVLLNMALLAVGLVATLWLSTAAAADSYRLQDARTGARALSEQAERLHREVASMESAPELARQAGALGMVPVQDPARLVVAPDGSVEVVGTPRAAAGPPKPAPSVPSAPAAGAPAAPGAPQAQPGQETAGAPADPAQAAAGQQAQDDPAGAQQDSAQQDSAQQDSGTPGAATAGQGGGQDLAGQGDPGQRAAAPRSAGGADQAPSDSSPSDSTPSDTTLRASDSSLSDSSLSGAGGTGQGDGEVAGGAGTG